MKLLSIGFGLLCACVLAACTNSPEATSRKLPLLAKTDCELVYKAPGAQVIENFCNTEWKPVKVYIDDQQYSVDWIDEKISRQVFDEGCANRSACYYELKLDGVTVTGRFGFATKLLQGAYTFEIDANENLDVLGESLADLPS